MTPDVLERRLADLAIDTPDPGRITALVMSRAARPQRRQFTRGLAIGVVTVALITAVLYFAPAADVVLADTPIARELLRDAGLLGAGNRVTSVGAVSTSSGYRLELVGAYADSTRTVLLVHAEPYGLPWSGQVTLTDQFGRSYQMRGGMGNALTGNVILETDALAWPDTITGARITLHLTAVTPVTCSGSPSLDPSAVKCSQGSDVAGSWTLPATVGVDEDTTLALPPPAQLGPASFRFISVRTSSATIAIDIEVKGVAGAELDRRIPDGKKGTAAFTIEMLGPNGEQVNGNGGRFPNEQGVHLHVFGYRLRPGGYHIHATYVGYGEFDRVIQVP
jgi:hypothetical protein